MLKRKRPRIFLLREPLKCDNNLISFDPPKLIQFKNRWLAKYKLATIITNCASKLPTCLIFLKKILLIHNVSASFGHFFIRAERRQMEHYSDRCTELWWSTTLTWIWCPQENLIYSFGWHQALLTRGIIALLSVSRAQELKSSHRMKWKLVCLRCGRDSNSVAKPGTFFLKNMHY